MAIVLPIISKFDPNGTKEAQKNFDDLSNTFERIGKIGVVALAAVAAGLVAVGVESVKAASNLQETTTAVEQVFGSASKSLEDFAKNAPKSLGQTRQQFLEAAKTFGIFGKAAGLAGEDNAAFSKQLAILATDLASFNNTSVDEAITAIGAGLRGESEPLRRFGVLLDDATLKARAMSLGIYDGTGMLTQQQRVLAAQSEILAQTTTQQGDFARTSDGLANSTRTLTAQWDDMQATIGQALLPAIEGIIPKFTEIINTHGPQLQDAISKVGTVVLDLVNGFIKFMEWADANPDLFSNITSLVGAMATSLLAASAAMWALNIAMDANPIVLAAAAIIVAIGAVIWMITTLATHWDTVCANMSDIFANIAYAISNVWTGMINGIIDGINTVLNLINGVLGSKLQVAKLGAASLGAGKKDAQGRSLYVPGQATGGETTRSGLSWVGERGPELLNLPTGAQVIPLSKIGSSSGGSTYNISINAGMGADGAALGEQIVTAIRKYERTSGKVFAAA